MKMEIPRRKVKINGLDLLFCAFDMSSWNLFHFSREFFVFFFFGFPIWKWFSSIAIARWTSQWNCHTQWALSNEHHHSTIDNNNIMKVSVLWLMKLHLFSFLKYQILESRLASFLSTHFLQRMRLHSLFSQMTEVISFDIVESFYLNSLKWTEHIFFIIHTYLFIRT